ncbi:tRNA dimethylallyltransferase [Parelusimicrobium proximum]|uniref:tRNA (adenosine(37)-N6)-dimethylallyltransferase MiaA n=1 Tax=Parelusimicrobium proximum TaxID=3228953 RepID=UPI003D184984
MKPVIIAGPTASGKTELALSLARIINGEIISVDSRQIYKELTIGTAKPEGKYINDIYYADGVPYYLVDFLEVEDTFNSAAFVSKAAAAEKDINSKGKVPVFTGGTGMYFQSYFSGMDKLPEGDGKIRAELKALVGEKGKTALHDKLKALDPLAAAQIPEGNVQRVMRAVEVSLITGRPVSSFWTGKFSKDFKKDAFFVYLTPDKDALRERIAARTEKIFDAMAYEAQECMSKGRDRDTPALKSLGYPQAIDYTEGKISRAQAVEKIITLTAQYAKRQRTWFNRYDKALRVDPAYVTAEELADMYRKSLLIKRGGNV